MLGCRNRSARSPRADGSIGIVRRHHHAARISHAAIFFISRIPPAWMTSGCKISRRRIPEPRETVVGKVALTVQRECGIAQRPSGGRDILGGRFLNPTRVIGFEHAAISMAVAALKRPCISTKISTSATASRIAATKSTSGSSPRGKVPWRLGQTGQL